MRKALIGLAALATTTACAAETASTPQPTSEPTPVASEEQPSPSAETLLLAGRATYHISCAGSSLLDGDEVRVRGETGELIAVGAIGRRVGDALSWEVEVEVPEARFYVVEVGADDTEDQTFAPDDLAEDVLLVANPPGC